jgi:hypothetical protein
MSISYTGMAFKKNMVLRGWYWQCVVWGVVGPICWLGREWRPRCQPSFIADIARCAVLATGILSSLPLCCHRTVCPSFDTYDRYDDLSCEPLDLLFALTHVTMISLPCAELQLIPRSDSSSMAKLPQRDVLFRNGPSGPQIS